MEKPDRIYLATTTKEWNNVGFAGIACTTKEDIVEPVEYIRKDALIEWMNKNIKQLNVLYGEIFIARVKDVLKLM